jgi:nucleotide-binding universal stress UspA family protein
MKRKKILIAVDGSPHSLNAVKYVAQVLAPTGVKVNLMYVMPTAPETFWDLEKDGYFQQKMKAKHAQWKRDAKNAAQRFLDDFRALLVKANVPENDVGVILQEREVGIARDIIAESERGYEAVVVGRRGLSKLEDLFLGSVSNKLIEAIDGIPVWVVGGDIKSRKILLAVDASENSREAVDCVGAFAGGTEAEITLFHVVRSLELGSFDDSVLRDKEMEKELIDEVERDIQRMFQSYKQRLQKAGVAAARIFSKYTVRSQSRAGDIIREATEGNYGTVAMGRRGLSKVGEFLMGRVTRKVLDRAEGIAVLIIS